MTLKIMKKITVFFIFTCLLFSANAFATDGDRSLLEKLLKRDLPGGAKSTINKNRKSVIEKNTLKKRKIDEKVAAKCENIDDKSLLEKVLRRDLPGGSGKKRKCVRENQVKMKKIKKKRSAVSYQPNNDISVYTGTFDVIDKEGDDQTSLVGIEHKNPDLFRDTPFGKISPITGAFVTGENSVYFYTGIQAQYGIGPLKIYPSFSPGYYEKGDGKDLGSVLEFKSEINVAFDILENSKIGYSYSHISNNDWGNSNPGTDNQQITFSKNF